MPKRMDKFLEEIGPQISRLKEEIREQATRAVESYITRVSGNLGRCESLLELHQALESRTPSENQQHLEDLLRAVVVFTHATVEDLIRTIAEARLTLIDASEWPRLNFAGMQAEKVTISQLAAYRGKTIDEVLQESLREHLRRTSFNNVSDITALLRALSFDISSVQGFFPDLEEMIRRRHQIVHQADLLDYQVHVPTSLTAGEVRQWLDTATKFIVSVLSGLAASAVYEAFEE